MRRCVLVLAFVSLLVSPALSGDPSRFHPTGRLLGEAEWLSVFDDRVAFGSGNRVVLARRSPDLRIEAEYRVSRSVVEGVLSWNRLYLNDGGALHLLDLSAPAPHDVPLNLASESEGALRLTRHGDNLALAEDGVGIRIVKLPMPPEHDMPVHRHMFPDEPVVVGRIDLPHTFVALTGFGHRIHAAVAGGGIVVVDGFDLERPRLVREIPFAGDVRSMAANGERLFALGDSGLTVVDLTDEDRLTIAGVYPDVRGRGIGLSGRTVDVAGGGGGLQTFHDRTPLATTHTVNVMGITFVPSSININPGDTVQWIHAGGLPHNVESCDGVADPTQCTGVAVEGQFVTPFPMPATGSPFTVSHTFTLPGANPYFCVVHVAANMVGTVLVNAPPPPGVPSGLSGVPLLVSKVPGFPDGARLDLSYDATTCTGNTDHQIIHAPGSRLPSVLGGIYFPSGGVCNIGSSGAQTWSGVPLPAPTDPLLWFLVLSEDNSGTEGSWGKDSAGGERNGFFAAGSSGQCGITTKSLTNTCGTP